MLGFKRYITEGVHDKGIFHAVFVVGAPGSGKDTIAHKTLSGHGLREINSDHALEHSMKAHGLDLKMPESEQPKRDLLRAKAKATTETKKRLSLEGRNGIIVNTTGNDHEHIGKMKEHLESRGYKTHMLYVHADDHVSQQRNIARGQAGGRTIPEKVRSETWHKVNANKEHFKKMFGPNFHHVDNNLDFTKASSEEKQEQQKHLDHVHKHFRKEIESKNFSPIAKDWITNRLRRI